MDIKVITVALVAVMVGAVVLGATYPIFGDLSDDQKTVFNNNYNRYSRLIDKDIDNFTMTVTWEVTSTTASVSINGADPYNYTMSSTRVPLINSEGGLFNANKANSRGIISYEGSATTINVTSGPITITVVNGVATVTDSADTPNTYTWDVGGWLFYPDNNGNYTAMNTTTDKDTSIYLNSIDDLYFATVINTDSLGFVSGHGNTCKFFSQAGTPSYSMSLSTTENVNGYTDIIKTSIGAYVISTEAGTNVDDTPFNPFITMVPRAVNGHTSMDNTMSIMFQLIPLVLTIGVLLGAIGWFISRKF